MREKKEAANQPLSQAQEKEAVASTRNRTLFFKRIFLFSLLPFFFLMLFWFSFRLPTPKKETECKTTEMDTGTVQVTGAKKNAAGVEETEGTTLPESEASLLEEKEEWMEMLFGPSLPTIARELTIQGLSQAAKEGIGFLESSFVQAASRFLTKEGIVGTQLVFEEEIPCSSPGAHAFKASIPGWEGTLSVLFFPDFPGASIFLLQKAEPEGQEKIIQETQPIRSTEKQPETDALPPETIATYDAAQLSILAIPESLLNYLKNQYELQFSLYRYLHAHGYPEVRSITVEGYQIDGENQTATIQLRLPDGESLTGVYERKENTYRYF